MTVCYNKTVSQFQVPTFPNWQETIPTLRQCHPTRLIGAPHSPTIFLLFSALFSLQGFWSAHSYQQASSASQSVNHVSLPRLPGAAPTPPLCFASAQVEMCPGRYLAHFNLVGLVIPGGKPPPLFWVQIYFSFPQFFTPPPSFSSYK